MKKTLLLVLSLAFLFCLCLTACSSAAPEESADPDAAESARVLIKYQNTLYMKYQKVTTDEKYLEDYVAVYQLKEAGETEKELKNLVPKENLAAAHLPLGTDIWYLASEDCLLAEVPEWGVIKLTEKQ